MNHLHLSLSLIFISLFVLSSSANADFYIGASDTIKESKEIIQEHQRLAKKLSLLLDVPVEFKESKSWPNFNKELLSQEFDITIAPAHIAAYATRFENGLEVNILGRFNGMSQYYLAVPEDSKIQSTQNLSSYTLCAEPTNKLSRVQLMNAFNNPILQPKIMEMHRSKLIDKVNNPCDTISIRKERLEAHNASSKIPFRSIFETSNAPNAVILLSTRIRNEDREKLSLYLYSPKFLEEFPKLFDFYAPYTEQKTIIGIDDKNTLKPYNILPGVVWGW